MTVSAWTEVQLAVGGALKLARGDPRGLDFFDTSIDGFWRSFRAALISYPFFLILLAFRVSAAHWEESGVLRIVAIETIGYVIAWVAFPLLVLPLTRWLGREDRFLTFMVAYNWSQVPQTVLLLFVAGIGATPAMTTDAAAAVETAAYLLLLLYEWFIARIALDRGALPATALVLLDVVLGAALSILTQSLY